MFRVIRRTTQLVLFAAIGVGAVLSESATLALGPRPTPDPRLLMQEHMAAAKAMSDEARGTSATSESDGGWRLHAIAGGTMGVTNPTQHSQWVIYQLHAADTTEKAIAVLDGVQYYYTPGIVELAETLVRDPREETALRVRGVGVLREAGRPETNAVLRQLPVDAGLPVEVRQAALAGVVASTTPEQELEVLGLLNELESGRPDGELSVVAAAAADELVAKAGHSLERIAAAGDVHPRAALLADKEVKRLRLLAPKLCAGDAKVLEGWKQRTVNALDMRMRPWEVKGPYRRRVSTEEDTPANRRKLAAWRSMRLQDCGIYLQNLYALNRERPGDAEAEQADVPSAADTADRLGTGGLAGMLDFANGADPTDLLPGLAGLFGGGLMDSLAGEGQMRARARRLVREQTAKMLDQLTPEGREFLQEQYAVELKRGSRSKALSVDTEPAAPPIRRGGGGR